MGNKTTIVCLVGDSGSGKTTLALKMFNKGYHVIQSYTTRTPREDNEWGHVYLGRDWTGVYEGDSFAGMENKKLGEYVDISEIIAYFNSYKSGNHYFATKDQVTRGEVNFYVVDGAGAVQCKEFFKDDESVQVITLFLQADYKEREERLTRRWLENGKQQTYEEAVLDRLVQDRDLFSIVACDYVVDSNHSTDHTAQLVEKVLRGL